MTTDSTQELDEVLDIHDNLVLLRKAAGDDTDELRDTTKQAIIDWHNKQVGKIIGEDEQANLREISRDVDMDSALALREYRLARNDLRAEQRNKLKESK